jgi:hypothetical protein
MRLRDGRLQSDIQNDPAERKAAAARSLVEDHEGEVHAQTVEA